MEILNYTFTKNKVTLLYPVGTQAKMRCKAPYKHDQIISTCQPGGIWSESQCQSNNVTDSSAPVGPLAGTPIND